MFNDIKNKFSKDKNNKNISNDDTISNIIDEVKNNKTDIKIDNKSKKSKKNNNFLYISIIIFIIIFLFGVVKTTLKNESSEKETIQEKKIEQKEKIEEKVEVVNLTQEEIALNRIEGKIKQNKENEIKNNKNENEADFNAWKKSIIFALGDTSIVDFYLDSEYPQIITRNFKQDGKRNYQISGTDAKINKIYLEEAKEPKDFLDIVVEIVANDGSKNFELKYPLLKYVKLHFFSDSIVKVFGKNNLILTEDSYIFPYLKIEKISQDEEGNYILFSVKQKKFDGKDFVFRYNVIEE